MSLIVKIGADTRSFERDMKKLTKDVQLVSDRLSSAGMTLTKAITVPLGLCAAAAIKLGMDFEASMSKLQSVTGASGKDLQDLQDTAMKMGADTKYSALEAADAMTELAKSGFNTKQTIAAIPGVLSMAASENMDLADACSITAAIMNGFGMSADQASHVADVLAKNSNMSATGVSELGAAMRNVAGFASQLGLSFEDVNAAIGIMSNAGIDGALAGDKLNQMLRALAAPSNEASKQMQALGINVFDANGKMKSLPEIIGIISDKTAGMGDAQKLAALKTMFGADALSGLLPLLKSGKKGIADYSNELKNSGGYADETAKKIQDNLKGAIENLKGSLETAGITLYNNFGKALQKVVEYITKLVNAFSNLSPETQKNILILAGIAAAVGPTLIVIAKLILAIAKFTVIWGKMKAAMAAGEGAFSVLKLAAGGPIGLIIAAIIALIAVIALIILNWDKIKTWTINTWNAIVAFLQPVLSAIGGFFSACWETIKSVWNTVSTFFQNIWNAIVTALTPLATEISGTFQMAWDVIKLIWGYVEPYFAGIWEAIKAIFSVVGAVLSGFFEIAWALIKAVWDVVSSYFSAIWESIKAIFSVVAAVLSGFFEVAWTAIKAIWNVVIAFFTLVWAGIKAVFAVVKGILSGDFSDAWDAIKNVWDKAKAFFGTIWDGIKAVFGAVGSWFGSVFSAAWEAIKKVFSAWGGFFSGLWDTIKNTFSSIGTSIANAIGNAVRSGINGVISMIEGTINTAVNIINGAIRLINKIPGVSIGSVGAVHLPRLATGGELLKGQAIVGEAGPELLSTTSSGVKVTPLSSDEKAAGIGGALGMGNGTATIIVPVNIDGRTVAKVVAPYMNKELKDLKTNKLRAGGAY